jgi:hypothetical protein
MVQFNRRIQPKASRADGGNEKGLTLIEAVIALLVTVIGLVSIAGMFVIAIKTNSLSRNLTTATTFAQDKLEQLETLSFQRLADPSRMKANPKSRGMEDAFVVGSLEEDVTASDGTYYFDKIILAGLNDIEPEGTITIMRPDGTAETRRTDGTVSNTNPFPPGRLSYSRRWEIISSAEGEPADRRLTIAVRVKSENLQAGRAPEQVDLYTVLSRQ